tara:strand:- start:3019 stop:3183 length:165 start_codon:yes stop_codon:yes gene_type:complete
MDVRTNQSPQTKDSLLEYYEFRIEAMLKKIDDLESDIKFKNGQLDSLSKDLGIY